VWHAANQKLIGKFESQEGEIHSVAFSGDGRQLVFGRDDGRAYIYDAATRKYAGSVAEPGTTLLRDATFSPDGTLVVTAAADGMARVWDASSDQELLALGGHTGPVESADFAKAGSTVITASADGTAKLWNTAPVEQRTLLPGSVGVTSVAFNPANPQILAVAEGNTAANAAFSIWNVATRRRLVNVQGSPVSNGVPSAEFSHDGRLLVTTSGNEQTRVWNITNPGRPRALATLDASRQKMCNRNNVTTIAASGLTNAVFNTAQTQVATSNSDGIACIWSLATDRPIRQLEEPAGASGGVSGGTTVGSASLRSATFSPDGKELLTASNDGTARIWDTTTGTQLQVLSPRTGQRINTAWFSPKGALVVTASDDGTAVIWDASTRRELHTIGEPDRSQVLNAAFSPDGRLVVTCGGSAHVWNAATGKRLTDFQYGSTLSDCEFSPNGSEIAVGGFTGTTRIFSTQLAGEVKQLEDLARQRVTRQLTAAERKEYGIH
jgi:WD40 repeat protein